MLLEGKVVCGPENTRSSGNTKASGALHSCQARKPKIMQKSG